jgi:hypothetical protein
MIPLYGFLQGDTLGLVVLAHAEDEMATLAVALARAARVRVAEAGPLAVVVQGRQLADDLTVAQAGLAPLDRFDVVRVTDRG